MKHTINSIFVGIVTWFWASSRWMDSSVIWQRQQETKPWVYRQLVPLLVKGLEFLYVPENLAIILVMVLSGIGFYITLALLIKETHNQVAEWKILVVVLLGLWIFYSWRNCYDLMTAFLWTLSLLFIVKQKHGWFMLLFPLVCLNRIETSPLLIVTYWLRFPKMYGPIIYSVGMVITTIAGLQIHFASVPGSSMEWFQPLENLGKFADYPLTSILHVLVTVVILLRIIRQTDYQPLYFQRVFVVLAPVFLILYWAFGQSFELRVFWELYPVVSILMLVGE